MKTDSTMAEAPEENLDILKQVSEITIKFDSSQTGQGAYVGPTQTKPDLRLLLVGKTGHGKSETGNSILGKKAFQSSGSCSSVTKRCDWQLAEKDGRTIEIVDTPGFFDTKFTQDDIKRELNRALMLTTPGFNAIAFVMRPDRFTDEMKKLVDVFFDFFGEEAEKFAFIIFTHIRTQDQLKEFLNIHDTSVKSTDSDEDEVENEKDWVVGEDVKQALQNHFERIEPTLRKFIEKCGRNIVIIDNTSKKKQKRIQVQAILDQIETIKARNNNEYFRNAEFQVIDELLKIERQMSKSGKGKGFYAWMSNVVKRFHNSSEDDENAKGIEKAWLEIEKQNKEKKEQENREKEERERRERELEQELAKNEKEVQEKIEQEFNETECVMREKMERELAENLRIAREKIVTEQRERQRQEREKMEKERKEKELMTEIEKREQERIGEKEERLKREREKKERREELERFKQQAVKDNKFVDDTAGVINGFKAGIKYAAGKVIDSTVDTVAAVGSYISSWL